MSIKRRHRRRAERIQEFEAAFSPEEDFSDLIQEEAVPTLLEMGEHLFETADPFEAECIGAGTLVAFLALDATGELGTTGQTVEMLAEEGSPAALAVLLFIADYGPDESGTLAAARAQDLIEAGVSRPSWADAVHEPVEPVEFVRYTPSSSPIQSVMTAVFRRAGIRHGFLFGVDYLNRGALGYIDPLPPDQLDEITTAIPVQLSTGTGEKWAEERLNPEQAHQFIEAAIAAKLELWEEDDSALFDEPDPDDEEALAEDQIIGLATLLGRRFAAAGVTSEPLEPGAHIPGNAIAEQPSFDEILRFMSDGAAAIPAPPEVERTGPAPVYRVRIDLRYAKPPIWRRLEIRADRSLAELHACVQSLFGWYGYHLHCFRTPYGDYADPDLNLGADDYLDARSVTLEQVLGEAGASIEYEYDFGDGHLHLIKLEAVEEAKDGVEYPRCTAGRRQAPLEDTGCFGLFADQVEALADQAHEHHADALAHTGIEPDDAGAEDMRANLVERLTARFDPAEATRILHGRE